MMKSKKWMIWITALLPIALAALSYAWLPETLVIHWGMDGTPNGFAPRIAIFPLGAIALIVTVVELWAVRAEPRREHVRRTRGFYESTIVLVNLLILAVMAMTVSEALHPGRLDVGCIATAIVGLLLAWIGNYVPKLKSNYMMGVRTRWALSDEANWRKTQRVGGWMMFVGGLVIFVSAFVLPPVPRAIVLIAVVLVGVLGSVMVSYLLYRRENPNE